MILLKIYIIVLIILLFYLTRKVAKIMYMEECDSIEYYKKYGVDGYDYQKDYSRNLLAVILWPVTFIYIIFITVNKYYYTLKNDKHE